MLRIGIDGRAFASPAPGIRRYIRGLTGALLALGEPLEIVVLGGRESSAVPAGTRYVAEPPHPPTNLGWTLVGVPRAARRARVDVIHAPAYTAPFWAFSPVVLTIHDVSYERHPEWYPYRRDWARRAFYRRSASAASHILTVSSFSATEIAAAYRIPMERMTVTPLGVDEAFAPRGSGRAAGVVRGRHAAVPAPRRRSARAAQSANAGGGVAGGAARRCGDALGRMCRDGSRRWRRYLPHGDAGGRTGRRRDARTRHGEAVAGAVSRGGRTGLSVAVRRVRSSPD